jgi:hypothetical protein
MASMVCSKRVVNRFGTVRPVLRLLVTVVDFDATPEGVGRPL